MKIKIFFFLLILLLTGIGISSFTGVHAQTPQATVTITPPLPTQNSSCNSDRTIAVRGEARFPITPGTALLILEMQSNGPNPAAALDVNQRQEDDLKKAMENLVTITPTPVSLTPTPVIPGKYSIETLYDDALTPKTYQIKKSLSIIVNNMQNLNSVLEVTTQNGVNRVLKIEYYIPDLKGKFDSALTFAMSDAKRKAEILAQSTQSQIGCVLDIQEESYAAYSNDWDVAEMTTDTIHISVKEASLPFGEIWGKVVVSVSYALK